MSYSDRNVSNSFKRFYRRNYRWLAIIAVFLIFYHFLSIPSSPTTSRPKINFHKSSYDWSQWRPFHPVASLQRLPDAKPSRLPRVQFERPHPSKHDLLMQESRRTEVKKTMEKAWRNYKERAWMRDELTPLTGSAKDTFGGWAASLVDALDTLWIMDMKDDFEIAARAAARLDFGQVQGTACNMFETTIRHLGGLLSAYDLSQERALLAKAVELGDMLYAGFDTPNHMPPFWFDFEKAKLGYLRPDDHQPSASAATLSMEFTRLAQLTNNDKYYDAVARVTDQLFTYQNSTSLPGLWPTFFDLLNNNFTNDHTYTLGALSDSMYEYVLKMHLLLGATEPKYEQMYRTAADAIIQHLVFRPMTPDNLDILFTGTFRLGALVPLEPEGQHLACFAGGMLALGGKIFNIPGHIEVGAKLTDGCIWAYDAFPTGVAPEIFRLIKCESLSGCLWDDEAWETAIANDYEGKDTMPRGFQNARDPKYILRPEALESVFILYRITGQQRYQDAAWRMFQSIQKVTSTDFGNAAIKDVTATDVVEQEDSMESFWMAETLKYLYLTFSPFDTISLDDFVFNTEAHPLRILKP